MAMKSCNYTWLRIIAPAALIVVSLTGKQAFEPPFDRVKVELIINNIVSITLSFELIRFVIFTTRKKFPGAGQSGNRILYTFLFSVLATYIITMSSFVFHAWYIGRKFSLVSLGIANFMQSILIVMLIAGAYEAIYFYTLLTKSEKEKEELLRANLQSQFDSLKGQVNPHFLFNSLNTLSSLISKDPVRAENFVVELSSVYRYLLKSNEEELTTLRSEINFIHSFLHLLKTRFGNGLQEEINIDPAYLNSQLPPLTLQMLVENVVKHNVIALSKPLKLSIYTTPEGRLVVKNNLQKKNQQVHSGKVGLANIISRYKLLKQPEVEVNETADEFIVSVPLIKTVVYENIHSGR
jgi:two-component system, LytTR family, sensor kinase